MGKRETATNFLHKNNHTRLGRENKAPLYKQTKRIIEFKSTVGLKPGWVAPNNIKNAVKASDFALSDCVTSRVPHELATWPVRDEHVTHADASDVGRK